MDINKIHGEIWYQVAYTIGLLEQGNKLSKEDIKDVSDKIYDILSSQLEPPVMQKIAEAFIRYLRSGNSYAKDNWTVNQIVKYEEDKEYCKTIYNENRLKMNFDDAHDLARTKLFEKIIKETLSGNFSA